MPLQALIPLPETSPLVVGMPAALRAARSAERAGLGPIFLGTRDAAFESRWAAVLKRVPGASWLPLNGHQGLPQGLDPDAPVLLLSPKSWADGACKPENIDKASVWTSNGAAVAAYYPRARDIADLPWEKLSSLSPEAFAGAALNADCPLTALNDPKAVADAERRLLRGLHGKADGFLARYDRAVSTRISALLARTRVTPNQITTFSLLLSLVGAWQLAAGSYAVSVVGAALLWFAAILDGCDGEVARLTFQSSPAGAEYDLFADHIAHAAAFAAIVGRMILFHRDFNWILPGALLAAGVAGCMFVMWWRIRRLPAERRNEAAVFFQKLGSRDYVYLILALTLVDRLQWLLWGAAVGSHAFWIAVLLLA